MLYKKNPHVIQFFFLSPWVQDSNFKAVPTILEKNKEKWLGYIQNCNVDERREITICCNSVLKIILSMESKTDIQIQNHKSYYADRLRNSNDIRNKDPATLSIYQKGQLKRYRKQKARINQGIDENF